MKNQIKENPLLVVAVLLLVIIVLQNAGVIPQVRAKDVNISRICGLEFNNEMHKKPSLPIYGSVNADINSNVSVDIVDVSYGDLPVEIIQ